MTTTISTTSKNQFTKIQKYLKNKKVYFTPAQSQETYSLTIFELDTAQTNTLITKMTHHFHLIPTSQQGLTALAA